MKKIYPKEDVCIGCRYCEIFCLVEHSQSKDIIKAFKMESPRAISRVKVEEEGATSFALQCRHCEEPECVFACITGAMYRDKDTGKVVHDADRCIGCWTCIMACPYGVVMRDEGKKRIASKCDLCPDLDMPACVSNCPNEALVYTDIVNREW